jgi:hypothetical protein
MAELDFKTFGFRPDNRKLLRRIHEAVTELRSFGDLDFRSAWLYYGSISSAARVFGISAHTYRRLLKPQGVIPINVILKERFEQIRKVEVQLRSRDTPKSFRKSAALERIPETEWDMIADGARMMLELPDTERAALFPLKRPLPVSKDHYIGKIESWRLKQAKHPTSAAKELLEAYLVAWYFRRYGGRFLQSRIVQRSLRKTLEIKDEIKATARSVGACSVALDILHEYEDYQRQWLATRKHIETQRKLISSNRRKRLLVELGKRDGLRCAACESAEDLRIDHIKAVSQGGLSDLENLQLLCHSCNIKKGIREEDFRLRKDVDGLPDQLGDYLQ